jgi:hypothetical protein
MASRSKPTPAAAAAFRPAKGARRHGDGRSSIIFKCPFTGLSDPDTADSSSASLNLALCSCKAGADETR